MLATHFTENKTHKACCKLEIGDSGRGRVVQEHAEYTCSNKASIPIYHPKHEGYDCETTSENSEPDDTVGLERTSS
jgi:hypothetical protein